VFVRCEFVLTGRFAGGLVRVAFVGCLSRARVSCGAPQREARETLALLQALPSDVIPDLFAAVL
jgi:hypothetical protein